MRTGSNLGRPWATFLIDAFSRRILAVYLTFDEPSYRSCMMVLRECVRRQTACPRHSGRLRSRIRQHLLRDMLARYGAQEDAARCPTPLRIGLERLFGTANTTFFHNLAATPRVTKNVRPGNEIR